MKLTQVSKLLKVCIIATFIMLVFEVIFSIDGVTNYFKGLITNSSGVLAFIIIWVIMFLQCTILNIPAYVVLMASVSIGINTLSWEFLLTVITAYMAGCILTYWLGRWFGVKAVRWCAGSQEDFDKWCGVINKKGKFWYFLTVLLPLFPDDLLVLACGSVKMDFKFFVVANLIGRSIGLVCMLLFLKLVGTIGGGFPFMIIVWGVALIGEVIAYYIVKKKAYLEMQWELKKKELKDE